MVKRLTRIGKQRLLSAARFALGEQILYLPGGEQEVLRNSTKNRAFPKLVKPAIAPEESVTTDILNEIRAIIPVSNTPVAI